MAILNIITAPDPILRQKALPVDSVDDLIRKLMDDMLLTMYDDEGVGLAANQVGVAKRLLVVDLQDTVEKEEEDREQNIFPLFIANPEIIDVSEELVLAVEGCLSLPGEKMEIARAAHITLKFIDYNNISQQMFFEGWLARVIQHEMDHLDGKLLVDYLSKIKKDTALRRLKKLKKNCL